MDKDIEMIEPSHQPMKRALSTAISSFQKKTRSEVDDIVPKKTRGEAKVANQKSVRPKLWLGFLAMEELAKDAGKEPLVLNHSVTKLVKLGYLEKEVQEL